MRDNKEWRKLFIERLLEFSVSIIWLVNKLPKAPAGMAVAHQLVKSGTSIGANFIEAQDASSTRDFIQKLSISLREARETWYWLKIIEKAKLLSYEDIKKGLEECDEIIAILVKSINSSKAKII